MEEPVEDQVEQAEGRSLDHACSMKRGSSQVTDAGGLLEPHRCVRVGQTGYRVAVWVPFVLPPLLLLLAVMLQAIETRLLGNAPDPGEPADVAVSTVPTVTPGIVE